MEKSSLLKKIFIFIISLIGFLTTIKLAMIYYDVNFNDYALPSFCSVNEFIDCDGIAKTTESQFFGVPLAYWGMFLYLFIMLLLVADKLKNFKLLKFLEVFKNPLDYIALLGIFSFCISMMLLCLSLLEIKKLCILCAFTYVLNLLIGLIAIDYKNGGLVKAFKQSVTDFLDAIKNRAYLIAFALVVVAAVGVLSYTSASEVFAPQLSQQREFSEFIKAKTNKYAVKGNLLGDEDANFTVYIYTDYNCPFCGAYDIMFHKAARELKGFKVVHKNLPLDTECNKYLKNPFHEGSCRMAYYAVAAEKQGKFWAMDSKLFEHQPQTEEQILEIARKLKLDVERLRQDANSEEVKNEVLRQIDEAYAKGVDATPSMIVGTAVTVGIKPYSELKKILEDAGAKPRK